MLFSWCGHCRQATKGLSGLRKARLWFIPRYGMLKTAWAAHSLQGSPYSGSWTTLGPKPNNSLAGPWQRLGWTAFGSKSSRWQHYLQVGWCNHLNGAKLYFLFLFSEVKLECDLWTKTRLWGAIAFFTPERILMQSVSGQLWLENIFVVMDSKDNGKKEQN